MLRTSVPEAPVHEHRDARTGEHEVRPATVEQGPPQAKSETQCVHGAAQRHFGCGVPCTPSSQMRTLGCGHPGSRTFPRRRGVAAIDTRHHSRHLGISVEGHPAPQPALTLSTSTHWARPTSTEGPDAAHSEGIPGDPLRSRPSAAGEKTQPEPWLAANPTMTRAQVDGQVILGAVARAVRRWPGVKETTIDQARPTARS